MATLTLATVYHGDRSSARALTAGQCQRCERVAGSREQEAGVQCVCTGHQAVAGGWRKGGRCRSRDFVTLILSPFPCLRLFAVNCNCIKLLHAAPHTSAPASAFR